jgi:hypothetical protein
MGRVVKLAAKQLSPVMARDCPKWRVDTFKIVLGLKLQDLTSKQRDEVLNILRRI